MADQHVVRALVAQDDAPRLRRELMDELQLPADHIAVTAAEPADYRDEAPDQEIHRMFQVGSRRAVLGALAGALLALLVVLVIPPLRDWLPFSLILLFGGAWGGGIAATARGIQTSKREDDLGEDIHHVDAADAAHLRLLTVTVDRDREGVVDLLRKQGATLLDSRNPKVGRGPGERPASPGHGPSTGDHRD
ncbi:hypothetical protein [Egicoccus halophilus]|uniref:Uncharacterized protein n=1 Tax=Egicoccus halophilus TaxID=1670830 RepID=A0A8J3A514_9ACTN|nr:hypothetical protein [Egicoccus halophilus]GGI03010.1 hypothetical protein GCM10011354_02310 [Egicoccus halophilus]